VKENFFKFDGNPPFPKRIAYTFPYKLSAAERCGLQEHSGWRRVNRISNACA
jgi:hypothetical protein